MTPEAQRRQRASPRSARGAGFADALRVGQIRLLIASVGLFTLGSRALTVVIGFQMYRLTHSPLALGWLGLIEAIPALSLVLIGGHVADHFNRHKILLTTRAVSITCAIALALLSQHSHAGSLVGLYAVVFLAGVARGFADPADTAFESQVVPRHLTVNASSWISSTWISCSVIGPAVIGFAFDALGASGSYVLIAAWFALSWACTAAMSPNPQPRPVFREPILKSIGIGWRFLFSTPPLVGALALDLFAVLFGGAVALLPIYADDILHVGATGLGLLNAAPALGALVSALLATRHPPMGRAGRKILLAVAGFGVSIIIFAVSRTMWLSLVALMFSGLFDGISVVIRRSMVRLLSPDHLRGRIAAASWVFVCASNELGAFESGLLASWIGTVPCVALGGVITLGIVALTASLVPPLRRLRFDTHTLEQRV